MVSGDTAESSWGLKGTEDLGDGLNAIFSLENGFDEDTVALNEGGCLFGRQAFVGLASQQLGTVSMGHQYDAAIDMGSGFTAAGNTNGDLAARPFDNDNADYDYRASNSIKYVSPTYRGFQAEAVFGFSNTTNFAANRTYSAAGAYADGGFSAGLAYVNQNGGATTTGGAIGNDTVFSAASQQNIDAGAKCTFADGSNVGFAYSRVDVYDPTANAFVLNR